MKAFNEIIYTSEELYAKSAEVDKVKSDKKSLFREGFEVGQEIDIKLTASEEGNVSTTGIVTATKFVGDGSTLTNITGDNIDSIAASKIVSGVVAPARLGTGTADSTTYLRGDGVWKNVNVPMWFGSPADSSQQISDQSWTTVTGLTDNPIDKGNGGWNGTTGVFTCPVGDAGIYWVYGVTGIDHVQEGDQVRAGFSKNGADPPVWAENRNPNNTNIITTSGMYSQTVVLAEGDTLAMKTWHNDPGDVDCFVKANRTQFGGYKLSA